jgi:SAM-dependent methyltransferase
MKSPQQKPTTFDRYAGDYAELLRDPIREKFAASNRFFFERKIQVVRRFFAAAGSQTETMSWLDVGCGQGDMLRAGARYFKSAVGCDPSEAMLKACDGLNVRKQESLDTLPFDDQAFDFITAVCVYHHVPDEQRPHLTSEAMRLLRPRGIFCVIEHNPWNPVTRLIVSRSPIDADARLLSARETRRLVAQAGADVLTTRYFLLFPESVHRYLATLENCLSAVPFGGQYSVFAAKKYIPLLEKEGWLRHQ